MALLECPDCHGKVSSEAPACPHCGRLTKVPAPVEIVVKKEKPDHTVGCVIMILALLFFLVIPLISVMNSSPTSTISTIASTKKPELKLAVSATPLSLVIVNEGDGQEGEECKVAVNGSPISDQAFKGRFVLPAKGQDIRLPLTIFVDDAGLRFNPYDRAVKEVWIGGNGHDHRQYTFER